MKKTLSAAIFFLFFAGVASAQVLPNFAFGLKGGVNFPNFPSSGPFQNSNQAGYIGGVWARLGALGFNFQPEAYVTGKDVNVTYNNNNETVTSKARLTSLDVPLLFGGKVGAFGFGARFYTGPLVSFAINKDNTFSDAAGEAARLDFKDQNYAWVLGAGVDIKALSIDLRYEEGLNKIAYGPDENSHTRINLFNLTLAYRLFSL